MTKGKKVKSPLKVKLGIFMGSLLFFLLLLELAMRLVGARIVDKPGYVAGERDGARGILCAGDSFTYGGRVARDETYPAFLQKRLDERHGRSFSVINAGECEANTSKVVFHAAEWIDKFKPAVMILLVGSANRFNPWTAGYHERIIKYGGTNFFMDFRVVKMGRLILLNLKSREAGVLDGILGRVIAPSYLGESRADAFERYLAGWNPRKGIDDSRSDDPVRAMWDLNRRKLYDEGIKLGLSQKERGNFKDIDVMIALAALYLMAGDTEKLDDILLKTLAAYPGSETARQACAYFYARQAAGFMDEGKPDGAVRFFLKAIEFDPNRFFNFYYMSKMYDLQSRYDSGMIAGELARVKKTGGTAAESVILDAYINMYKDKKGWDARVEKWIYDDLARIADLCRDRGIKLIIQNYPVPYPAANGQLEKIAGERNLPFADNLSLFGGLSPEEKYIFDDGHCTAEGHKMMADNIYKLLLKEHIVEDR